MQLNKQQLKEINCRFSNYVSEIKEDLLNQIIRQNSNSRSYFENQYDEIFIKYLSTIKNLNYNEKCCSFIHDIYELIPISNTI